MDAKVKDLTRDHVVFATPNQTVGHVVTVLDKNNLSLLPVIDSDEYVVGVVSVKELLKIEDLSMKIRKVMIKKVFTIPQYESVTTAARMMRNQKIHHLVVTHEKKLIGLVSSFDVLKLVEGHRFTMKNRPTPKSQRKEATPNTTP